MPDASEFQHALRAQISIGRVDEAVGALATRQHGVVGHRQLRGLGVTRTALEWRVRTGRLRVLWRGVYAVGHEAVTLRGRWMAATLLGGRDAALSHRAAAALWGLWRPAAPEVATPRQLTRGGITFHRAALPDDERTTRDGIPVTTPARTLLDLAGTTHLREIERAVDAAELAGLGGSLSLGELLERHPRRAGAKNLRWVLERGDLGLRVTRSKLERDFLALLRRRGLPLPQTNVAVLGFECDAVWHDERLIVELDTYGTHGGRRSFREDRRRDRALGAAGWRAHRVSDDDLRDAPDSLVAELAALLRAPRA